MRKTSILFLTRAGLIAALYAVLTPITPQAAGGLIQFRFSEVLLLLPLYTSAAVPGLTIGCILGNLLSGCALWDIVFGSLITLVGALSVRLLRRIPLLSLLPNVFFNGFLIPLLLTFVYGMTEGYFLLSACVLLGEFVSVYGGYFLFRPTLEKTKHIPFQEGSKSEKKQETQEKDNLSE